MECGPRPPGGTDFLQKDLTPEELLKETSYFLWLTCSFRDLQTPRNKLVKRGEVVDTAKDTFLK